MSLCRRAHLKSKIFIIRRRSKTVRLTRDDNKQKKKKATRAFAERSLSRLPRHETLDVSQHGVATLTARRVNNAQKMPLGRRSGKSTFQLCKLLT